MTTFTDTDLVTQELEDDEQLTLPKQLKEFTDLEKERRQLEAKLKACKQQIATLSPVLMEEMAMAGIQSVKAHGMTVFTRQDFYCSKKAVVAGATTEKVCEVLRSLGYNNLVSETYSAATLKSIVKEMIDNAEQIPEQLKSLINYDHTTKLVARQ